MSDENNGSGFLGSLLILLVIIGLSLAAIYFTGYWYDFMDLLTQANIELQVFLNQFMTNIGMLGGTADTIVENVSY